MKKKKKFYFLPARNSKKGLLYQMIIRRHILFFLVFLSSPVVFENLENNKRKEFVINLERPEFWCRLGERGRLLGIANPRGNKRFFASSTVSVTPF